MDDCLSETGFDEISFLSLSTGDFSALKTLCFSALDRCAREQIGLSLPSLRVGSIDDEIIERMADLRRTGCTLAVSYTHLDVYKRQWLWAAPAGWDATTRRAGSLRPDSGIPRPPKKFSKSSRAKESADAGSASP